MKKIMMLFVLSVFFFVGDVCDGVAQSNKNSYPHIINVAQGEILAKPGRTVRWSYTLLDLENWTFVALYSQRPGESLKLVIVMDYNKFIYRPVPSDKRFSIFCDNYRNSIDITLSNVQASDEVVYYLSVRKGTMDYYSIGDQLVMIYL